MNFFVLLVRTILYSYDIKGWWWSVDSTKVDITTWEFCIMEIYRAWYIERFDVIQDEGNFMLGWDDESLKKFE